MSHAPSTLGSMTTSSLSPTAATISMTSSSAHGELSALIRVHSPVVPKSLAFGHLDEAAPRRLLGIGGNGVLEIAEHHVDLADQVRHLLAYLGDVRRHEMDHALQPHRQFAQRRRRADRQRLEELTRKLHREFSVGSDGFRRAGTFPAAGKTDARRDDRPEIGQMRSA